MNREVTARGLFWAFEAVWSILLLISVAAGFIMGAGNRVPAYITGAIVGTLTLAAAIDAQHSSRRERRDR